MRQPLEWARISARIKGLGTATASLWSGVAVWKVDHYGISNSWLIKSATEVIEELRSFRSANAQNLPVSVVEALTRRLADLRGLQNSSTTGIPKASALCTALLALESELSYHMVSTDAAARPLIERAFLHLQRLLVVDPLLRASWTKAFEEGEIKCEKLGAAHLLHHGIYAFKTSAEGERTDLVLGEKLDLDVDLQRATRALVLTEWKVARKPTEITRRVAEAIAQAERYSAGILLGFEVESVRYIIVVSRDRLTPPEDRTIDNVLYRIVNIAIESSVPSAQGRP